MRHPFWKWTGWLSWLSVSLAGCLHSQDWRAAVSKPLTRTVADRRESPLQPKVVGPLRKGQSTFVPSKSAAPLTGKLPPKVALSPTGHMTPSAITARPPAFASAKMDGVASFSTETTRPPTVQDEAQPRGTKLIATEFVPPSAPPSALPTVTAPAVAPLTTADLPQVSVSVPALASSVITPPATSGSFAEFERTIARPQNETVQKPAPVADEIDVVIVPEPEPTLPPALPIIIPARMPQPAGSIISASSSRQPESATAVSHERLKALSPNPVGLAKELPAVPETTTSAHDQPRTDAEQTARAGDVAALVEQVFEDLRHRRLDEARQRTEWLKQLVTKRASASLPDSAHDTQVSEPRRLQVDPQATAIKKSQSETFLDEESRSQ